MKIFITGATGFIGKHLVAKLISEGHQVTINLFGDEKSPFDLNVSTYKLNETNISSDSKFLIAEDFDGIIHLASLYLTEHKPEEAICLINTNVKFSTYILECGAQANIKWFINTGTFWQHYNNADYSPVNLYAASKQAFESIAQYYIDTNKIIFCTIKLSDTFGPKDTRPKIFNLWDKIARTGETLDMSLGEQIIDISYIDDITNAYIILANQLDREDSKNTNGLTYAVKANERFSLRELALIYENARKKKLKINWGRLKYREREVMIPWENGITVPTWISKTKIHEGIKNIINE